MLVSYFGLLYKTCSVVHGNADAYFLHLFHRAHSELQDFSQGYLEQQRGDHCVNLTEMHF